MKREILYKQIYDSLLEAIKDNRYRPGDRMPSEKELSEEYNVSRITSKKALEMLKEEGYINRVVGKGSFVREFVNNDKDEKTKVFKEPVIGVIIEQFGLSFGSKLLRGIEKECRNKGFAMMLHCTDGDPEEEIRAIDEMVQMGVSGIIIMCVHNERYNTTILKLAVEKFPIVAVDRQLGGIPISFVGTDNKKAAKELTKALFKHGYRRICYATPSVDDTSSLKERKVGFIEAHADEGIHLNEELNISGLVSPLPNSRSIEKLRLEADTIRKFVSEHPEIDSFFAAEYNIAKLIIYVLRNMGMYDQYKVVCFDGPDDIFEERTLTHVLQNEEKIGREAIGLLSKEILGDNIVRNIFVPYKINWEE